MFATKTVKEAESTEREVNKQASNISVVGAGFSGKGIHYIRLSKPGRIIN